MITASRTDCFYSTILRNCESKALNSFKKSSWQYLMCLLSVYRHCVYSNNLRRQWSWWPINAVYVGFSYVHYNLVLLVSVPPHLHLTISKVMVIVWRLKGNIIRTVLYISNMLPLQWAQLTKTVHTARLGLEFFLFFCFLGCMICLYVGVCFVLPWTVESFPFMLWHWRNKLKRAPFEFFCSLPIITG